MNISWSCQISDSIYSRMAVYYMQLRRRRPAHVLSGCTVYDLPGSSFLGSITFLGSIMIAKPDATLGGLGSPEKETPPSFSPVGPMLNLRRRQESGSRRFRCWHGWSNLAFKPLAFSEDAAGEPMYMRMSMHVHIVSRKYRGV